MVTSLQVLSKHLVFSSRMKNLALFVEPPVLDIGFSSNQLNLELYRCKKAVRYISIRIEGLISKAGHGEQS